MLASPIAAVQRAVGRIAPLHLAAAWDNVGVLIDAPVVDPKARRILLTIDLTAAVLEEALSPDALSRTAVIVSYHPPIFKPLRSLTLSNPLQRSLLTCVANNISVYSPHTALDVAQEGVNDWLARCVLPSDAPSSAIAPIGTAPGHELGEGKLVTLPEPLSLDDLLSKIKASLALQHLQLAKSRTGSSQIQTIALCAGSGASVIGDTKADVYFTGEMSHHEVLAAVASGTHVILCGHTNTERPYLSTLKRRLDEELELDEPDHSFQVDISQADAHPLAFV